MNRIVVLLLVSVVATANTAWAAGDPGAGKAAYAVCLACHGANGEGNLALNAPALAGLSESYLARQLNNFKQGIRGSNPKDTYGAQMRPMSMALADKTALNNVAAYLASLAPVSHPVTLGGDAGKGKTLYATCGACHGARGEGNPALNAPALTGLQDWYLARQLQNFKDGIRGADGKDAFGAQMRPMAMTLADEQAIKDVAAYIVSLGQ